METIKISRILIVGSGSIAARHLSIALQLHPNADIRVFSETGNKLENGNMISGFQEIERFLPELSILANSTSRHLEVGIKLAKLGSHLLIEKPISNDLTLIGDLIKAKRDLNLKISIGYNIRYLPSFKLFSSLIASEEVGRILDVRVQVGQDLRTWRPDQDYRKSVSADKAKGGGVLRELSHEIDYVLTIFGYPTWVFASTATVGDLEVDVEDIAHVIFGLKDDEDREFMATLSLDFVRQDKLRTCTVLGTHATIEWDLLTGKIVSRNDLSHATKIYNSKPELLQETYVAEWEELVNAILMGGEITDTITSSIHTLEVIAACETSQVTSGKIYLKEQQAGIYD